MMQTKIQSLLESLANTFAGMGISFAISFFVYPLLGMQGNAGSYALATAIFTGVSIARNYVVRRMFDKKTGHQWINNDPFYWKDEFPCHKGDRT